MATNTYVALDKQTLVSNTPSVTFTNISQVYTDLVLIVNTGMATADVSSLHIRVGNGSVDTGTNYSSTDLLGDGTSATSGRTSNASFIRILGRGTTLPNTLTNNSLISIMNYANTTTYKTLLVRGNVPSKNVQATTGLWSSTSAINTITISDYESGTNLLAGSTFSLYGVQAWAAEATPKATGGYVTSDSTYWYHTFPFSSTFTPLQSLTADILVVAGGGSGGTSVGGGGGGGGLVSFTSQSLSATGYTITVGAGASPVGSNTAGNNGNDSQFGALTLVKGGGGGGSYSGNSGGKTGGSGGGGAGWASGDYRASGGSNTSGQGNVGGNGYGSSGDGGSGGGGGAGSVGGAASKPSIGAAGQGGQGSSAFSSWGLITGTGVPYAGIVYYAGGGGGVWGTTSGTNGTATYGASAVYQNGIVNSGQGGGGDGGNAGGSGIIIVRYAK
jgi:hypothetical protein